jgi:Zn-dependent protease
LRSRLWESLVSFAGPAMNLIIFVLLCVPLMPAFHWANYDQFPHSLASAQVKIQIFLAAMAFLQFYSVILNLCPIPPLDGFGIIAPYLPAEFRRRMLSSPWNWLLFVGFFMVIWKTPIFSEITDNLLIPIFRAWHIEPGYIYFALRQVFRPAS